MTWKSTYLYSRCATGPTTHIRGLVNLYMYDVLRHLPTTLSDIRWTTLLFRTHPLVDHPSNYPIPNTKGARIAETVVSVGSFAQDVRRSSPSKVAIHKGHCYSRHQLRMMLPN